MGAHLLDMLVFSRNPNVQQHGRGAQGLLGLRISLRLLLKFVTEPMRKALSWDQLPNT